MTVAVRDGVAVALGTLVIDAVAVAVNTGVLVAVAEGLIEAVTVALLVGNGVAVLVAVAVGVGVAPQVSIASACPMTMSPASEPIPVNVTALMLIRIALTLIEAAHGPAPLLVCSLRMTVR